jgi:hypothetical protein
MGVLPAMARTKTFHETYEVEPDTILEVQNKNGSVTITRGDQAHVDIFAEKRSYLGGNVDNVKIEVTITGKTMTVETVYLRKNPRVSVTYKISVPEGMRVKEVTSSDGSVKVTGTKGDLEIRTSDGSVEAQEITGNVKTRTSDGSVTAENIAGDVEIKTSDGSITIKDVTGNIEAKTSDGSVTIESVQGTVIADTDDAKIRLRHIEGYVSAKTSDGSIEIIDVAGVREARTSDGSILAEIRAIQEDVHVKTSDGSITLYLSPDLDAEVDMKTSNGKISIHELNIAASKFSNTKLEGKLGDGGHRLMVETSDSNIDVYKLQ